MSFFEELLFEAETGDPSVQFELGNMYAEGLHVGKDILKAFQWYRKSAVQGYAKAQYVLGSCYPNGEPFVEDLTTLLRSNYCGSLFTYLSSFFSQKEPLGGAATCEEALNWCQKAAEGRNLDALFLMGVFMEAKNPSSWMLSDAITWYEEAAYREHRDAQFFLGRCYHIQHDERLALKWWKRAAENGDLVACFIVGVSAQATKDYNTSVFYFRKAAEGGSIRAEFQLGMDLQRLGQYQEAVEWLERAGQHGDANAQYHLGKHYADLDTSMAIRWYKLAAEQNFLRAHKQLAKIYFQLNDYVSGCAAYEVLAEDGDMDAQVVLANCYRNGVGVQEDLSLARLWYKKAMDQGHYGAEVRYKELVRRVDTSETTQPPDRSGGDDVFQRLMEERIRRRQAEHETAPCQSDKKKRRGPIRALSDRRLHGAAKTYSGEQTVIDADSWKKNSPLTSMGYHVGESSELTLEDRRKLLSSIIENELVFPSDFPEEDKAEWGEAGSRDRLERVLGHISQQIILRANRLGFETAVQDWQDDLDWLSSEYSE